MPQVLSSKVRIAMENFAEEWAKRLLRDEEFNREVVEEAKRAFFGAARGLRRRRRASRKPTVRDR